MEEEFDLPPSTEELAGSKGLLYESLSFLDIMKRYTTSIMECWHSDFTHKCTCPLHGQGKERTPSFYFSERSKTYKCFACNESGDIFDLIGVMEGKPWFFVVKEMLDSSDIDPDQVDLTEERPRYIRSDIGHEANLEMSVKLRDYLSSLKEHPKYDQEKDWVDWMFRRIDDRLENLDDSSQEETARFRIRIGMELERRKALTRNT